MGNLVHLHNHYGNCSTWGGLQTNKKHHSDFIDVFSDRWTRFDLFCNPHQHKKDSECDTQFSANQIISKGKKGLHGHDFVHYRNVFINFSSCTPPKCQPQCHFSQYFTSLGSNFRFSCLVFQPSHSNLEKCDLETSPENCYKGLKSVVIVVMWKSENGYFSTG